jgi:hypothetical protein
VIRDSFFLLSSFSFSSLYTHPPPCVRQPCDFSPDPPPSEIANSLLQTKPADNNPTSINDHNHHRFADHPSFRPPSVLWAWTRLVIVLFFVCFEVVQASQRRNPPEPDIPSSHRLILSSPSFSRRSILYIRCLITNPVIVAQHRCDKEIQRCTRRRQDGWLLEFGADRPGRAGRPEETISDDR